MNIPVELKIHINHHIELVQKHLVELPFDEQREILASIEAHIYDALESRSSENPTFKVLESILAELDPPESYRPAIESNALVAKSIKSLRPFLVALIILGTTGLGLFFFLQNIAIPRFSDPTGNTALPVKLKLNTQNSHNLIVEGSGWSDYKITDTRDELIRKLGIPQTNHPAWLLCWDANSFVNAIITEQGVCRELRFDKGFKGHTTKGIRMGASESQMIEAYGNPEHIVQNNGAKKMEWSSKGLLAWLTPENGVHQIVIFKPYEEVNSAPETRVSSPIVGTNTSSEAETNSSIKSVNSNQESSDKFEKDKKALVDWMVGTEWHTRLGSEYTGKNNQQVRRFQANGILLYQERTAQWIDGEKTFQVKYTVTDPHTIRFGKAIWNAVLSDDLHSFQALSEKLNITSTGTLLGRVSQPLPQNEPNFTKESDGALLAAPTSDMLSISVGKVQDNKKTRRGIKDYMTLNVRISLKKKVLDTSGLAVEVFVFGYQPIVNKTHLKKRINLGELIPNTEGQFIKPIDVMFRQEKGKIGNPGLEYEGYLVVISDRNGNVIALDGSKNKYEQHIDTVLATRIPPRSKSVLISF